MSEQQISKLLDKQAMSDVSMRYAGATDRMDAAMLRAVFHSDSQHANGFVGPLSAPLLPSQPGAPLDVVAYAFDLLKCIREPTTSWPIFFSSLRMTTPTTRPIFLPIIGCAPKMTL